MKMVKLRGDDRKPERPYKHTDGTTSVCHVTRVRVDGYSLIADRAAQSTSGKTHVATLFVVDGVTKMDPMTDCGLNSGARPKPMKWVKGPVLITCKKCTINGFLDLCREGKLP